MGGTASLPERGHLVIRGATILTMDPALGELEDADVEVREGEIVAVGEGLDAPNAQPIDGAGSAR